MTTTLLLLTAAALLFTKPTKIPEKLGFDRSLTLPTTGLERSSEIRNSLMNRNPISWQIAPEPAALTRDEFWARYDHFNMPEKFEAIEGKLFWNEEQRLHVLAMLLEAVGLRRALALCPPEAVRSALADPGSPR